MCRPEGGAAVGGAVKGEALRARAAAAARPLTALTPAPVTAIHMRRMRHGMRVRVRNVCATGLRGLGGREILISSQDLIDGGSPDRSWTRSQDELFLFERLKNRVKRSQRSVRCSGQNRGPYLNAVVVIHFCTKCLEHGALSFTEIGDNPH